MAKGSFLGFDYGTKHIGVAAGQTVTQTASPVTTIHNSDFNKINWDEVLKIISNWRPEALIVGMPFNMDGSDNEITVLARKFAENLRKKTELEVHEVDERLSSKAVGYEMERLGKKIKAKDDALAACIILESFLKN